MRPMRGITRSAFPMLLSGLHSPVMSDFRDVLASFPSGVTIVTTADEQAWHGFTATSFCSVSLDPPLVLVCLARTARCHPAFTATGQWMVHVLPHHRTELATRFATRGADKFGGGEFTEDSDGLPVLPGCPRLKCRTHRLISAGDHTILLGEVIESIAVPERPAVYFGRKFHRIHRQAAG
jgi:flavin reductase ActVB